MGVVEWSHQAVYERRGDFVVHIVSIYVYDDLFSTLQTPEKETIKEGEHCLDSYVSRKEDSR